MGASIDSRGRVAACWFAEIKPHGVPVPEYQREVYARLRAAGFEVRVLRGVEDAEAALVAWGLDRRRTV